MGNLGEVTARIQFQGVSVRLGETDVLRELTATLEARSIAVIGENGSGKSTFARLIGGLIPRTSGELEVLGLDPAREGRELRRRVAFVFSNPDVQIIMPTVAEDVAFSLRSDRLPSAEVTARVTEALERVGLSEFADRSPHDLSGGQKQLLAVCGALIRRPELLIADEPTGYLDARNARIIERHLLEGDHQLILVTHDMALARQCEQAVFIHEGRIAAVGEPKQIIAEYEKSLEC